MKDSFSVKINHQFINVDEVFCCTHALFCVSTFIMIFTFTQNLLPIEISMIIMYICLGILFIEFVPLLILTYIEEKRRIMLKADNEAIWLDRHERKKISFSEINEFYYTTSVSANKAGYRVRLKLCIVTADNKKHCFNDFLKGCTDHKETSIIDDSAALVCMYRFLEERLPDKAKGYIE